MASDAKSPRMTYRFLGNSGLLVSKLSLGSWMYAKEQYTAKAWYEMMKVAFEHGRVQRWHARRHAHGTLTYRAYMQGFGERVAKAEKLKSVVSKLGISLAEIALAWCVSNESVSTVMIGASSIAQLEQNLKALGAVEKITLEVKAELDALVLPFVAEMAKSDGLDKMRGRYL
ncbi:hypothetical protein PHYSODRAFT_341787 [Phytophthora sojae]|uniref:NADP-dependent oxidoreductase domain-containing protein n=1 Tax=Phytophthora sojae (strain P6497) TaxID=1094619 RepID=G5AED0_PHYSP|nr:hypothetical protein PHYSODRAFT_341787 [Phytophthora sojae]EGZ06532.1 hypothetical protein PHYSODRAFT_341787 [Phytophthora sojae]|eukprot:XP_009538429.1 hypothetical protein PHYSODRAFT_341787 [Phytophthora sojae]